MALKDYTGERFGRLVALAFVERKNNVQKWRFRCDCGNERITAISGPQSGRTSSCGCILQETNAARNLTHGLSLDHQSEYRIWKTMRARCNAPGDTRYSNYGGRGITVCARWDSFSSFLEDMGPRPKGMSIDRIDNDGNYESSNCRWADATTQANNKRSNHRLTIAGETKTLIEWCRHYSVSSRTASARLKRGVPAEMAFSQFGRC